jgi:hypothetical protein
VKLSIDVCAFQQPDDKCNIFNCFGVVVPLVRWLNTTTVVAREQIVSPVSDFGTITSGFTGVWFIEEQTRTQIEVSTLEFAVPDPADTPDTMLV